MWWRFSGRSSSGLSRVTIGRFRPLLDRYLATADEDSLAYNSFSNWLPPELVTFLRRLLDEQIETFEPRHGELAGRLDVLIRDGTFVKLVESAAAVYPAFREDAAGCKVHLTESMKRGVLTNFEITDAHIQDRSALNPGSWMEDALVLLDLGYYDFWLFFRIDANDGWFVTRGKENANPVLVEEHGPGGATPSRWMVSTFKTSLGISTGDVIDVRAEVTFKKRAYRGFWSTTTECFRLVRLWNDDEERYHLYLTNLPVKEFDASEIGLLPCPLGGRVDVQGTQIVVSTRQAPRERPGHHRGVAAGRGTLDDHESRDLGRTP